MAAILIVGGREDQRELLAEGLHCGGYTALSAADGKEAVARFAAVVPDLVLLDMRMPGLSGLGPLERLLRVHTKLPVVLYTRNASGRGNPTSSLAGVHVVGGADIGGLTNAVREILGDHRVPAPHLAVAQ